MRFESWSKSDVGLVRESNQDHVGCFPDLGLYIVADGMGGHADGEIASGLAVDSLREAYDHEDDTQPGRTQTSTRPLSWLARLGLVRTPAATGSGRSASGSRSDAELARREVERLVSAVEEANRRIFERGHRDGGAVVRAMGTTVIAVVVHEWSRRLAWAHVGDSRLYRLRAGELMLLTADHTRFGEPYRDKRPVPLDLPHTNQLTSALGVAPNVGVEAGSTDLAGGDVYLLSSDGVSGLVPPEQLAEVMTRGTVAEIGEELLRRAMAKGGTDNASVVVLRVLA
ncbi:protein phosphatase 2C domain-containing protein [Candidatus Binatia bacterium]|jgi:protein phosphatase|nr:protein phosphatase 2C domain-containing protein [Candidatus Binatia bacterium]